MMYSLAGTSATKATVCLRSNPSLTQGYAGSPRTNNVFSSGYSCILLRVLSILSVHIDRLLSAPEKSNRVGTSLPQYLIICFWCLRENTHKCLLEASFVHIPLNCDGLPAWQQDHRSNVNPSWLLVRSPGP